MARRLRRLVDRGTIGPGASSDDERALTLAFQSGDSSSYDQIFRRYSPEVEALCRRILGSREDAREASQEVFLRVYQRLGSFNGRYQLGAWIRRITTNVCLDQLRARQRRPIGGWSLDEASCEELADAESSTDPEASAMSGVDAAKVHRVLDSLPPLQRAAVVLRDHEGLSYCEVADALDLSPSQAKALIFRSRRHFRRSWRDSLAAFVPLGWLPRLRGADGDAKAVSGHFVNQTSHVFQSCGAALQQCGHAFAGNFASLATAAVVSTTAAVSGGVPATAPDASRAAQTQEWQDGVAASSAVAGRSQAPRSERTLGDSRLLLAEQGPSGMPSPEPSPTPSPQPSSSAKPSPAPSPNSGNGSSTPARGADTPPTPPPFQPAVGFGEPGAISGRTPVSHTAAVDCSLNAVDQHLETVISYEGRELPAVLELTTHPGVAFELFIQAERGEVRYSGGGPRTGSRTTKEGRLELTYSGSYGGGGEAAERHDLPRGGSFQASLALDCTAATVVTESVAFGT